MSRRRIPLPVMAFATAGIVAVLPGVALACSCVRYASAAAQLADTQVMVVARAEWTRLERGADRASGRMVTRFTVHRTLKGASRRALQVAHHTDGASCGVTFQPGREYVVLIGAEQGRLATGSCRMPQFPLADYRLP